MLTLLGCHVAHIPDGIVEGLSPLWRKISELGEELARFVLLLTRQVLPGLHAVQDALLLLRRKTIESLQLLAERLLALRRQTSELRVVFECLLLLRRGHVSVAPQPVSRVATLTGVGGTRNITVGGVRAGNFAIVRAWSRNFADAGVRARYFAVNHVRAAHFTINPVRTRHFAINSVRAGSLAINAVRSTIGIWARHFTINPVWSSHFAATGIRARRFADLFSSLLVLLLAFVTMFLTLLRARLTPIPRILRETRRGPRACRSQRRDCQHQIVQPEHRIPRSIFHAYGFAVTSC